MYVLYVQRGISNFSWSVATCVTFVYELNENLLIDIQPQF